MELKSNHVAPVLAESAPIGKSRLGLHALLPFSPTGASFAPHLLLTIPRKKTGVLDDVRSSSWLDAMKASSPPPYMNVAKDSINELLSADADAAHRAWQIKYPSALSAFEKITNFAKGKKIALFLDYDGTLSPIVDNPDHAFMSDDMRAAVKNVARCFPTAIISGRSRDKVYEFVGLKELYYAGSHGMDIMGPVRQSVPNSHPNRIRSTDKQGKEVNLFQPASEFLPMIDEVFHTLVEGTRKFKGATVENNKFCVSVHYRNVDEKYWEAIGDFVQCVIKNNPRLRLTHGRKVLEIRPVINWDKGKAVTFLLESLGLSNRDDVLPIYVGDDRTDEDAFKVLCDRGCGCGILVSSAPVESYVYYSLKDPSESFSSPLNQVQSRIWLMHWSLFIFFNHDNGRTQIIDLFNPVIRLSITFILHNSSHLRISLLVDLRMVIYHFVAQLLDVTIILPTVFILNNNIHLRIGVVDLGMVILIYDGPWDCSSFKVL